MTRRIEWSVGLEFVGDPGESVLDALMDALDKHGGSVGGGAVGKSFRTRLATKAATARDAGERAEGIVRSAAKRLGFGPGAVVAIDVESFDHLIATNRGVDVNALVGLSDIAKEHGFSRQRAHELAGLPGFPKPVAALTAGRVWRLVDVERFLATPRAAGRPKGAGSKGVPPPVAQAKKAVARSKARAQPRRRVPAS